MQEAKSPAQQGGAPVSYLPATRTWTPDFGGLIRCLGEPSWRGPTTLGALIFGGGLAFVLATGRPGWPLFAVLTAAMGAMTVLNWRNWFIERKGTVLLRRDGTGQKMSVSITRRHDSIAEAQRTAIGQDAWIELIARMDGLSHDDREYDIRNPVTGKKEHRKAGPDTGLLTVGGEDITLKWVKGDIRADAIDDPAIWKPLLRVTRFFDAAIVLDDSGERIDRG